MPPTDPPPEASPRPKVADGAAGNGAFFNSPAAAFHAAAVAFQEAVEYGSQLLALRLEQIRLTTTKIALFAALGILALFVGVAVVATAGVLVCLGLAGAVNAALGTPGWVGALIVGVVIVAGLLGGVFLWIRSQIGASSRKMRQRLDQRSQKQKDTFGHDAHEYVTTPPTPDASKN